MARPITAGVDGSDESLDAADWAADEAARRGLPLRLLHAWLWQPLDLPIAQDRDAQAQWAQGVVTDAETRVRARRPELSVSAGVVSDTAVAALLAAAEESEMLVIGSRGHGALVGFLVGSYGQQVIASAKRPVVAVRAGQSGPPDEPGLPAGGPVTVGQQGTAEDSASVLRFAFETAAARGATVRAVRAWALPPVLGLGADALRAADEAGGLVALERRRLAEALAPWRKRFPEVPTVEHVEMGSAAEVLLTACAGARLAVVGRRVRRSAVGGRIGSVAHAALHLAPCPVAVVPHD
ncbi:universal stress protein [Streptomyces sp. MUM 178J]|uniref:universal stress protein n=1 Tax=Streptomyces sp. MUM 178J TaxID=2791991 RepID=UPI001F03D088|nr:universal stress protein [Streptomyces sp. MUM 178J]WRQ78128.1 universal stress protein [Streptomyces sp. MUM 178J]